MFAEALGAERNANSRLGASLGAFSFRISTQREKLTSVQATVSSMFKRHRKMEPGNVFAFSLGSDTESVAEIWRSLETETERV
jgi:hypothetical protein